MTASLRALSARAAGFTPKALSCRDFAPRAIRETSPPPDVTGWVQGFVLFELACQLALLLPGIGPMRIALVTINLQALFFNQINSAAQAMALAAVAEPWSMNDIG